MVWVERGGRSAGMARERLEARNWVKEKSLCDEVLWEANKA